MDLIGFLDNLVAHANDIDMGRRGLATDGKEHEGRISYEKGIAGALTTFQEAQSFRESQIIILAELIFLQQELEFCNEADTITRNSLTLAIQSFGDALRCLKIVEDPPGYQSAEATYPTASKYRIYGLPKDAFHLACIAHRTRLQNILRAPGINMIEKAVLQQRSDNMIAAQGSYVEKQKKILIPENLNV